MREPDLESLFTRYVRGGDVRALGQVFDRSAPELFALAAHLTRARGGPEEAEDLLQETFLGAIESAPRWDRERPLMPWLVGILTRTARYGARRGARRPEPSRISWRESADPATNVEREELVAALAEALRRVPPTYRDVLTRHLADGENPGEIAAALGRAPGTVRVQLHRGLGLLRKALPPSFALGAAAAALPTRGLAAVRGEVLAAAATRAAGAGSAAASPLLPRVLAAAVLVAAGVGGAWGGLYMIRGRGAPAPPIAPEPVPLAGTGAPAGPQSGSGELSAAASSTGDPERAERSPLAVPLSPGDSRPAAEPSDALSVRWFLRGRVTSQEGFDGTQTEVALLQGGRPLASTRPDYLGNFELELPGERLADLRSLDDLLARADHPDYAVAWAPLHRVLGTGFESRGREWQARVTLDLERPRCVLTGRVENVPGPARVALFPLEEREQVPEAQPADEGPVRGGKYRLRAPAKGRYLVVATADARLPAWGELEIGASSPRQRSLDVLTLGEGRTVLGEVRLPGGRTAERCRVEAVPVSVLDAKPDYGGLIWLPRVRRRVYPTDWQGLLWNGAAFVRGRSEAQVDAQGRFTLQALATETCALQVLNVLGLETDRSAERTLADERTFEVVLVPPVSLVRARVHDGQGPVAGARLTVLTRWSWSPIDEDATPVRVAHSDEEGVAEMLLPSRQGFQLQVTAAHHTPRTQPLASGDAGRVWLTKVKLELADRAPGTLRLTLADGAAEGELDLYWKHVAGPSAHERVEATDGVFVLSGIVPGPVTVRGRRPEEPRRSPYLLPTVEVPSGGTLEAQLVRGPEVVRVRKPGWKEFDRQVLYDLMLLIDDPVDAARTLDTLDQLAEFLDFDEEQREALRTRLRRVAKNDG